MMFAFTKATAVVLLVAISATQVCCYYIDIPFSPTNEQLAKLIWRYDDSVFRLEDHPIQSQEIPITNASVRVLYNQPFKLRNKHQTATFATDFVLNLHSSSLSPTALTEGVAFVLTADPSPPAASEGQWLGIVNASTNGTAEAKILAIEFDTRKSFPDDIDDNHVGLDLNSIHSVAQKPLLKFGVNLSDIGDVFVKVIYDGINISIYVSSSARSEDQLRNRVIFYPLNISFLPDDVYVGFSTPKFDSNAQLNWKLKSWQFFGTDVEDKRRDKHVWIWILVVAVIVVFLCGVTVLFICVVRKRKLNDLEETYAGIEDQIQNISIAPRVQKFGFRELKKATNNFNSTNKLGRGGFGTVYKGNLMNKEVAIKRISKDSRQGKQEFIAEVATIGGLHHKNLVRLIGWCYQKNDLLLVYEYMPNGSLDKLTYDTGDTFIWDTRYNIICGIAQALNYLHNECKKTILHRDIKPSNVMLDSNLEAKLGDFGLARSICRTEQTHHSTREIAGTRGYMAPETFLTRRATMETDVYAFGILILEVVCGRKPASELSSYGDNITHWVWEFHKSGEIVKAADERIEAEYEEEEDIERVLILGLACCHPNPHQRPTMKSALQVLKKEANWPDLPREMPLFVWPLNAPSGDHDTDNSQQLADSLIVTELVGR